MRMTTGMMAYPLFPDWVFEDVLDLDPEIKQNLIHELQNNPQTKTHYGWCNPKKHFTHNLKALNQLIGAKFADSARYQFKLSGGLLNIEIGESWAQSVAPGQCVPAQINHHRWYQSVYFLDVSSRSGGVYFEDTTGKRQVTVEGVQEFHHHVKPEQGKIIFYPAHLSNGILVNESSRDALYVVSTFVIKP